MFLLAALIALQPWFTAPTPAAELHNKQAVVETTLGSFAIDFDAEAAPNLAAYFAKLSRDGAYEGTAFHRMIKYGLVQGGDPVTKDPTKRALYGTGGLNAVKAEARAAKMTKGSVGGIMAPGKPDSAGAQFFVALVDQPGLDGQYSVFGHVSEGMEVLQKISETPVDEKGLATERVEIKKVTVRDIPPEPFVKETNEELAQFHAIVETSMGNVTLEFFPEKAPNTVRQFYKLAAAGVFSNMAVHRVAPGFVIQTGSLSSRTVPLTEKQQKLAHAQAPEFNDTRHVKGIVSMARGDDPASATTSFFICTGVSAALDGNYTAFGRVIDGMGVVEAMEKVERNGEAPVTRIDLKGVRIVRADAK